MKNAFMILPLFFLNTIAWALLCPFFYSLAQPGVFYALADGQYIYFLSGFLENILNFIPTATVMAFTSVYIFIMRHGARKNIAVPVILFLFVFAAGVLIPLTSMAGRRLFDERTQENSPEQLPEAGFIRSYEQGKKLLWLEETPGENTAVSNLIAADFTGNRVIPRISTFPRAVFDRETSSLKTDEGAYPVSYFNPGVEKKLESPAFLSSLADDIKAVNAVFSSSLRESAASYIFSGTAFFAAIGALFFLCFLTDWKLINILIYLPVLRLVYKIFPLIYEEECRRFLEKLLPGFLPDEIIPALPAFIFAVILSSAGLFFLMPRYRKRNPRGAES